MTLLDRETLLIDEFLPGFDVRIAPSALVDAPAHVTFAVAREIDLMDVHTPLMDAAFWVRGLPARLRHHDVAPPPRLVVSPDGMGLPGWVFLGERPGRELAFGAVGRFWTPTIEWHDVTAAEFADFAEAGWGKIACNFAVEPHGPDASIFVYECRVAATDDEARRGFTRYWWLVRPFVNHILGAAVQAVRAAAEAR